jgi:hypothetical protein
MSAGSFVALKKHLLSCALNMKSIWTGAGGAAVVFTGAVWFVDSAQTFDSYYETYQKLKETERISRGWVSRVIPTSSYDIHAIHQLNGELVSVRFRFQPEDVKEVESSCSVFAQDDSRFVEYRCQPSCHSVVVRLEPSGEGRIVSSQ